MERSTAGALGNGEKAISELREGQYCGDDESRARAERSIREVEKEFRDMYYKEKTFKNRKIR